MNFIRSMLIDGIDVIKMEKLQINKTQKIFEESYQITCDKYPNYEAVLVVCKSRRSNNYINLIYQNLIDEINLDEIEASLLSLKFID